MGEDFWARKMRHDREIEECALRTTPTREMFVWVWHRATRKWVPGALAGWERDDRGRVLGQAVFVWRHWDPRERVFISHRSVELVSADRLLMVEPAPTPPPPKDW